MIVFARRRMPILIGYSVKLAVNQIAPYQLMSGSDPTDYTNNQRQRRRKAFPAHAELPRNPRVLASSLSGIAWDGSSGQRPNMRNRAWRPEKPTMLGSKAPTSLGAIPDADENLQAVMPRTSTLCRASLDQPPASANFAGKRKVRGKPSTLSTAEFDSPYLLQNMGLAPMWDGQGKMPIHPDEKASIGERPEAPTAKSSD